MLTIVQREWNFWSVLGFSTVTLATWEATSALFFAAYTNGGPASVVYGFIVSVLGTLVIAASMAEMASMLVFRNSFSDRGIFTKDLALPLLGHSIIGRQSTLPQEHELSLAGCKAGSHSVAGRQLSPPLLSSLLQ
jgi:hypothetical protein